MHNNFEERFKICSFVFGYATAPSLLSNTAVKKILKKVLLMNYVLLMGMSIEAN